MNNDDVGKFTHISKLVFPTYAYFVVIEAKVEVTLFISWVQTSAKSETLRFVATGSRATLVSVLGNFPFHNRNQ